MRSQRVSPVGQCCAARHSRHRMRASVSADDAVGNENFCFVLFRQNVGLASINAARLLVGKKMGRVISL